MSSQFQDCAIEWIQSEFGEEYVCKRQYSPKGTMKTQDAHEAIRPINIKKTVPNIVEQAKLYDLIKLRAIASQMSQAIYSECKTILETKQDKWESIKKVLIFAGFTRLKGIVVETSDNKEKDDYKMDDYKIGDKLNIMNICVRETAAIPNAPFNAAGFVKMLEKTGIGRPSTYSSIIERIQEKGYVSIGTNPKLDIELSEWNMDLNKQIESSKYIQKIGGQKNIFLVTDLGIKACEFMENSPIESIVNSEFTSKLEDKLDLVAEGKLNWRLLVQDFHKELSAKIALQPPPSYSNLAKKLNWVVVLNKSSDNETIGIIRTQYGLCIGKEGNDGKVVYSQMPPSSNSNDLEIDEANNMFNYPLIIKDNIEIRIGQYGWYVTDGTKKVSLGKERIPPTASIPSTPTTQTPKH